MSHPNHVAYTRFAIAMHWSIAILILLNLMIGIYMDTFPHNSSQFNGILFYHASIGSLIFMLTVPRLAWRATRRRRCRPVFRHGRRGSPVHCTGCCTCCCVSCR